MKRLRSLGIYLQGARNTALQVLVSEIPAPLVAEMLGYSDRVTQRHAAEAGNTWAGYVQREIHEITTGVAISGTEQA